MEKFNIDTVDIRSLKALVLIHELGSLTAAARKLTCNQSSLSYTLDRLRKAFADPLFVRAGRGVEPSSRCTEIVGEVRALVTRVEELSTPPEFDPATSRASCTMSCNHFESAVLLPGIVGALRAAAPGVKLNVLHSSTQGHDQLAGGACDLLISPVARDGAGLYRQTLFADKYVCLVDAGNAPKPGRFTLSDYRRRPHIQVTYGGGWRPFYMDELARQGVDLDVAVELPSFSGLSDVIRGTDLVVTLPSRLAHSYADGLAVVQSPFQTRFDVHQFWMARTHQAPMQQWLRRLVADAVPRAL